MSIRSSSDSIFVGKDFAIEHRLPQCLNEALEQSNEELSMATRLQFAFGLLSRPKKVDKVLASILLKNCKEYFDKLGSELLSALLDFLYSNATDKQLSQGSINNIKSIGIGDPEHSDLRILHHIPNSIIKQTIIFDPILLINVYS